MTLSQMLPYDHPFAGGYPRIGGQPLPTDPDAIDYLERVAAADGAAVEQGVAMAVDAFVRGCKADSAGYAGDPTRTVWDALQACCVMAGARTISGALVPLKGTAPTPYNLTNFDYARSTGIKGDGSTTYLDSNRADDADGQNDSHRCVYVSERGNNAVYDAYIGSLATSPIRLSYIMRATDVGGRMLLFERDSTGVSQLSGLQNQDGFLGGSRSSSASFLVRAGGTDTSFSISSATPISGQNSFVFARNLSGAANSITTGRLAFYSIGSAIPGLAALDARVSTLISSIAAALS